MITYGVCDAIFSMAFGSIIKFTGRIPIFILGAVLNVIVIAVLFNWMPNPDQSYVFFILAGIWGIADAVWQTQINGKAFFFFFCLYNLCNQFKICHVEFLFCFFRRYNLNLASEVNV